MRLTPPKPRCPRCGYDLSGAVATWKTSCPLEVTCSECGQRFKSIAVFRGAHPIVQHRLSGWLAMLFIAGFFVFGFVLLWFLVLLSGAPPF